jgi:hypothetical protein
MIYLEYNLIGLDRKFPVGPVGGLAGQTGKFGN